MILLSTAYMPNIQYFTQIVFADKVMIEQFENYPKQTFRNRCNILAANGTIALTVPVVKGRSGKTLTKDIKISYADNWQHQHYQTIVSAYASAPFFDFYFDDLKPFFNKKYVFLLDLNTEIINILCQLLNIDIKIIFSDNFIDISDNNKKDFRFCNNAKSYNLFETPSYIQVFSDRYKYISNLSILDVLFNLGTETNNYLKTIIN